MVDTFCGHCGRPIRVHPWRARKFAASYCSRACSGAARTVTATATCEACGEVFTYKPFKKQGEHIFCSFRCAMKYRTDAPDSKFAVPCSGCGRDVLVHPSRAARSRHVYCSIACRAGHIVGRHNPAYTSGMGRRIVYGENWKQQRRAAKKRDGSRCQHCHKRPRISRNLHVHHIQPFHTFGGDWRAANQLANLITLCHQCHRRAERGEIALQPRLL